ncbi:HAD-like domain-containing protein, partial [Flammula alnicola]
TRPPLAALLIDISGNLHVGSTPTPNAVEAFHRLRGSSIPFRLCSNTSKESTASLVKRLDKMGFEVSRSAMEKDANVANKVLSRRLVWTSIGAVAQVIKDMGLKEPLLLLSDSAREEVVTGMGKDSVSERDHNPLTSRHDSVVIGLAPSFFDYANLNTAFRILKGERLATSSQETPIPRSCADPRMPKGSSANTSNNGNAQVPLIATHKAKYIQTESGLSLGPGPFVTALESAAGVKAHVVGKPTKAFFQMVIQDFGEDEMPVGVGPDATNRGQKVRARIAVIGDDVEADLGEGAIQLGLWRILVKTGKYRKGDERRPGVVPPDEVFDSFAAFIDSLL